MDKTWYLDSFDGLLNPISATRTMCDGIRTNARRDGMGAIEDSGRILYELCNDMEHQIHATINLMNFSKDHGITSSTVYSDSFDEMVQKDFTYKGNKYTWNDSDCVYYNDNGDEDDFFMEIPEGAITSSKEPIKSELKKMTVVEKEDYQGLIDNISAAVKDGVTNIQARVRDDGWIELLGEEPISSSRKPIKSSHDRETLKKVIRAYLDKMGYKDVEGGVDAAADYILQNEEYYSDYDFHSKVKQWFKETKENYPETLIKASKSIKSDYYDTTIESAKSEFGYDAHETMTFDEFKSFVKGVVEPVEMFDYKGAYFVILNTEDECKKLNNELDDTYGVGCTYYSLQDPNNEHYGKWQFMA